MLLKICPIFLLLLVNSHAYEITGGSPDTLVASGDSLSLTCDIDGGDYNLCQWSYVGGDWDCMTYSNALNEELSCTSNDRAKVTGTESSCSLVLEDVSLDDQGEYQCMVGKLEGQELAKSIKLINVRVAQQSSVELGGAIAEAEEKWILLEDEEVSFSCHANGGSPAGEISGFLGDGEDINEDEDIALDESNVEELINGDDERLFDVTKEFSFTPSRDDCGKYLKCFSKQMNEDGDLVYADYPSVSKKIMVVYPPQPLEEVISAGFDEETEEPFDIEIIFSSHPLPTDEQVTWHLGDQMIHPGEELEDQFVAHSLEHGEDHSVKARLTVNHLTPEDADLSYSLSAVNNFYQDPVSYDFDLGFHAKSTTTTTTTTTTTSTEEVTTYKFVELMPHIQKEGIGGASIAAIVIIIIIIIISAICIIWLKKNEMLCFAVYEEVNQKTDVENGNAVKTNSIVKE